MKCNFFASMLFFLTTHILPGQTTTSTYYYAHSLIWHQKETNNQANIPFWLAELEKAASDKCLTSGKHVAIHWDPQSAKIPPGHSWAFTYSNHGSAMTPGGNYVSKTHDNVVLTYMNWEIIYDYGSSIGQRIPATIPKAKDSIAVVFNWLNTNDPGVNLYLYECWPKIEWRYIMDGNDWNAATNTGNPPNSSQWVKYLAYALGNSNAFWKDLQDSLITRAGITNTKLIPSSMICAKLWQTGGLLSDLPVTSIFEDLGPHGKPSAYFLAAMIVYAAQHKKAPIKPFNTHPQIDQRILDRFSEISTFIMSELNAFNFLNGNSRVWKSPTTDIEKTAQQFESKFRIYPNPANEHITIEYDGHPNLNGYTLKITNSIGTTVFSSTIRQKIFHIDVNNWGGNGIYFGHIMDGQGTTIDFTKILKH